MKQFFEEPKLNMEQFAVTDVLTASNWFDNIGGGDDETGVVSPFGSNSAIGG